MTAPAANPTQPRGGTAVESDLLEVRNLAHLLRFALEAGAQFGLDATAAAGASIVADRVAEASLRLLDDFSALHAAGVFAPAQDPREARP